MNLFKKIKNSLTKAEWHDALICLAISILGMVVIYALMWTAWIYL